MDKNEARQIKGLLTSALYFDEYHRQQMATASPKPRRKPPKSKKTLVTRAKNKQARVNRKKNRK